MVAPITGPFLQSILTAERYLQRQRYKQRPPYNLPAPYYGAQSRVVNQQGYTMQSVNANSGSFDPSRSENSAMVQAYNRLVGQLNDRASLGEFFGTLPDTYRLVSDGISGLSSVLKSLRKRDPSFFWQWWTKGATAKQIAQGTPYAKRVLQVNFGIRPTIDDIFLAANVLDSPFPAPHIVGSGRSPLLQKVDWDSPPLFGVGKMWTGVSVARYGCYVSVSNPNTYLLNQLGLLNPAQILWQILPGSFLLDWLIPIESWLGQATDFCGLNVERPWTCYGSSGSYLEFWPRGVGTPPWKGTCSFVRMYRTTSLILPSLAFRPLQIPGRQRALNACSLFLLNFSKR